MVKKIDLQVEAAFSMESEDRFHSIISSGPIRYDQFPDHETNLTFFVIRRANGKHDIVHVMKTFQGEECISRQVQTKLSIGGDRIKEELATFLTGFAEAIRKATGFTINWDALDLAGITDHEQQIKRIQTWEKLGLRFSSDIPPIGLN